MNGLSIILQEDLPKLKSLYECDKPLHLITTTAIGHFIERFKKKPEWTKIVTFWSLNDNWRRTGTFAMVNTHDDHIIFNTLEPAPNESLRRTLECISYDKPMAFIHFRDIFRPVVFDVIRIKYLEVTFDSGTKFFYGKQPDIDFRIEAPDGFYFDSLNQSHVDKINSMWIQRHARSYEFLSNCISQNPSTGLFHKQTGELVAWILTLETGATGHLVVIDKYRRRFFGAIVSTKHWEKMKELGLPTVGHVVHGNEASIAGHIKFRNKVIDNNSWIGIRPKQPPKLVPLWGHL